MRRGTLLLLLFIILLAAGASFVNFWPHVEGKTKPLYGINNPFTLTLGLDLQGGTRVTLIPVDGTASDTAMNSARDVIASRIGGGLGVKEPTIRVQNSGSTPSIVVELPQFSGNQEELIGTLLKSGKLEFWDTGAQGYLANGTPFEPSQYTQYNTGSKPQFVGNDLDINQLGVSQDPNGGQYAINFAMKGDKAGLLGTFTGNHIGDYLTITLDKSVITSAVIKNQLPGSGQITGHFTLNQANAVVNTLKYGALPVNLKQETEETIGGTLGGEAITQSIIAGTIGLSIVMIFMLLYYRLPGLLADVALILYSLITFAVFKMIGVTMTLAGIAGFILSIGMAVDANVLIFERVKEELRDGRILSSAIDIGWKRAWPSIRDSNSSTLITCAILYTFGQNFNATLITGFATTLFLGVVISMFTAIVVTRTFLNLLVPTGVINHPALFGLPANSIPAAALARQNSRV